MTKTTYAWDGGRGWLAPVPPPIMPARDETPLAGFVRALREVERDGEYYDAVSGAVWTRGMFEASLIDGLSVVARAMGPKLDLPAESPLEINTIMRRMEGIFNIGLILSYETMRQAAESYASHLTTEVAKAMTARNAARGEVAVVSTLWMKVSARFIAMLIRAASTLRVHAAEGTRIVEEQNVIVFEGAHIPLTGTILFATPTLQKVLSLEEPSGGVTDIANYVKVRELPPRTERELRELAAQSADELLTLPACVRTLATLPMQLGAMPERVFRVAKCAVQVGPDTDVASAWMRTMLFLVALDPQPGKQYLEEEKISAAVDTIKELPDDVLLERLEQYTRSRTSGWSANLAEILREEARNALRRVRQYTLPFTPSHTRELFLQLSSAGQRFVSDHDEALRLATRDETVDIEAMLGIGSLEDREELLRKNIVRSVDWMLVPPEREGDRPPAISFYDVVEAGVLSPTLLAEAAEYMGGDAYPQAARIILEKHPDAAPALCASAVLERLEDAPQIVMDFWEHLPSDHCQNALERLLTHDEFVNPTTATHLMAAIDERHVRAMANEPRWRDGILGWIIMYAADPREAEANLIPRRVFFQLRARLGEDLWARYMLSLEIVSRELEDGYGEPVPAGSERYRPPWDTLWVDSAGAYELGRLTGQHDEDLKRLLTELDEVTVYRWLNEGHPKLEQKLTEYLESREAYYRYAEAHRIDPEEEDA